MDVIDKHIFDKYPIDHYGAIWDKLVPVHFGRKTVLPKDILCFLQKGLIRKAIVDSTSDPEIDISVDFFLEGDIFTAKADNEVERQFSYQPISKGVLWYVAMDEVRKLFLESKLCSATQKVFLEEQLRAKVLREIQLLKSTPEEMYLFLLKHTPLFIQYVPLKYLSSYIGVTPQALSRIRRRIS
ncbi:Crp/Fnr family transcriptional regulator [Edaphocola aurantiacus]|uniref:Crp/Fnr family transcriptional regulator n=1 Tax=Edaphocola aurantiacus TaxID=2601682 RepID=UPI001C9803D1|nr:hypothetical protein [Edaphocola aurantiacus]